MGSGGGRVSGVRDPERRFERSVGVRVLFRLPPGPTRLTPKSLRENRGRESWKPLETSKSSMHEERRTGFPHFRWTGTVRPGGTAVPGTPSLSPPTFLLKGRVSVWYQSKIRFLDGDGRDRRRVELKGLPHTVTPLLVPTERDT